VKINLDYHIFALRDKKCGYGKFGSENKKFKNEIAKPLMVLTNDNWKQHG